MTKMTYVVALDVAIAAVEDVEVKEKLTALKAQFEKKATSERKPTKVQIENEGLKANIVKALTVADKPMCIREMMDNIESLDGLTNQRITHLLTDLVKGGTLERSVVKKVPYFAIATA